MQAAKKEFSYPPFVCLIRFELKHKNFETLQQSADWFTQALEESVFNCFGATVSSNRSDTQPI